MKKLLPLTICCILFSCNKNNTPAPTPTPPAPTPDTNPPVIALKGKVNDTISLNTAYIDPGATASDNVDGNVSANIVVTGTINKDLIGEYRLYYNVKDVAGNNAAQMTRYVYVKNDADYLVGTYNAVPNCGASSTLPSSSALAVSNSVNNQINFSIPANKTSIIPVINVIGNTINIPFKSNINESFSGSGTIAADKKSFTLTTTSSSTGFLGNWNCTTIYSKL